MSTLWGKMYDLRAPYNVRGGEIACLRVVRGFSIESWQKDTISDCPPRAGATRPRCPTATLFRKFYDRGEFPIMIDQNCNGKAILWKIPPEKLDYHHYLPLFFDGLREIEHPYAMFARQGIHDMLVHGCDKVLPVVPQLIRPLREALNTRCPPILKATLHALQQLIVSAPKVGECLVPYYRQLLPVLNIFKNRNLNLGDMIEYGQYKRENIGDLIQETLELMERYGGEDAFINIKYMIPTYESVCLN